LTVTFLTQPETDEVLVNFYKKVKPAGKMWSKIYTKHQLESSKDSLPIALRDWIYGIVLVYTFLFGLGKLFFGIYLEAVVLLSISFIAGFLLLRDVNKMQFETD
jgi:hypothetical protein